MAVTAVPDSFNVPVAGRVTTVMLAGTSFSKSLYAPVKFAAVNVSVVSSVPLTPMAANVGASFTGVTVMVKVCAALVSTPLLAVPPLS